jgi:hypothetical protein
MDENMQELLRQLYLYIAGEKAIEELTNERPMSSKEQKQWQMLNMQVSHVIDYLEEEHTKLMEQLLEPISFTKTGEVLIVLTEDGFDSYYNSKDEIYEGIKLKTGCTTIHIVVPEIDRYYVQTEGMFTQNVGQIPTFGSSLDYIDNTGIESMDMDRDFVPFMDFLELLPQHIIESKISIKTCGAIISLIADDSKTIIFNSIVTSLYEDNDQS